MKKLRPYQQECLASLLLSLKQDTSPVLVNASVGAGKSLIIAELLLIIEKAGWKALCLTLNSELIRQNVATYKAQKGNASIYCASLREKDLSSPIVFASPGSIHSGLKSDIKLQEMRFNLIVIDEAHNVNPNDSKSMYIRLLNHYGRLAQEERFSFRVVGLTGTPFRGKGNDIVGEELYFKKRVGDITTSWLIENNYLVTPLWGKSKQENYDFNELKMMPNGLFNKKHLGELVDRQRRLTGKIMLEVASIVSKRKGAFIFASTIKHCEECLIDLPEGLAAIITGDTPYKERMDAIEKARRGELKFLINVNVLTVGVDIPNFDTIVFVRPTESLVLYTQAIGRGLRLNDGKTDCLILDYAGNLDRHGNIDDPIINKALNQVAQDNEDYVIPCYCCNTMNKPTARRCIGVTNDERCDHYFEFRECPNCGVNNDIVARLCRNCSHELINPNKKLSKESLELESYELSVKDCVFSVKEYNDGRLYFWSSYLASDNDNRDFTIVDVYNIDGEKSKKIFYYKFMKLHHPKPSDSYNKLSNFEYLCGLINEDIFKIPIKLKCIISNGTYKLKSKIFE